jgi:hypothetical protein
VSAGDGAPTSVRVHTLRYEIAQLQDRLRQVQADARAARRERGLPRSAELPKLAERVRALSEEIRRRRLEVERIESGAPRAPTCPA